MYIYGSYRKIKTGVSLFWTTLYSNFVDHDQPTCRSPPYMHVWRE